MSRSPTPSPFDLQAYTWKRWPEIHLPNTSSPAPSKAASSTPSPILDLGREVKALKPLLCYVPQGLVTASPTSTRGRDPSTHGQANSQRPLALCPKEGKKHEK
ncbi:NAC domain-containing protein [Psidium guajava]|nr:NAC domain-containing protein [Psidium guajava]